MNFDFKKYDNELLFVPLGGSNEIGMNLNLYRYQGKWLMVDLGIGFADDYLPGVDVVTPNIDAIVPYKDDLLGLVITHAHEDHIGAVGYLWEELECDIYATPFTGAVLSNKLAEAGLKGRAKVHSIEQGKHYELGPFTLDMVPLTHSIPEMHAIAIKTDKGVIMHTGDWKLDSTPMVGPSSDEKALEAYGDAGVLAMVCDSTNVMVEGESGSEGHVRQHLADVIAGCEKRVVVTTFASNIARLESIIYAARDAGRSVALSGKSLWRITQAARDSGYLQDAPPFLTEEQIGDVAKENICIICTGCQGESRASLTKIARQEHPRIKLSPGDTIVFSSRVIPGNETKINWLQNKLVEQGLELIGDQDALIHVSGHPCREELTRMYQLVRPKISIPVHGEARHIHEHANLARELQVPEQVEATNGAVILLKEGDASIVGMVDHGYLAMDGKSLIDSDSVVIRTRRKMRDDGHITLSLVMNKRGELVADPLLSCPGVLDDAEPEDRLLMSDICDEISQVVERANEGKKKQAMDDKLRGVIRKYMRNELGKKPVINILVHQLKK